MGYIDPKIQNLLSVYDVALKKIEMQLNEASKAGRVLDYLNQQRANVEAEIKTLNKFCQEWSEDIVPGYYQKGALGAYNDYRAANIEVSQIGSNFPVVENLTNNLSTDLLVANNLLGRRVVDMVRTAGLEAITMKLSTGDTIKHAQSLLAAALDQFGVENIVYKNGRKVSIKAYAAMVARTTTREATNLGAIDQVRELGALGALVMMTESATTCEVCAVYEGRVYSVDGAHPGYPPLSDAFGPVGYATIHPNCTHSVVPYIPKYDKNAKETREKSNMPYELTPEAQAKVDAYHEQQKEKAQKYASKKAWEKAKAADPEGTAKTFSGWLSQKRAEKKAYEKAQVQKALMQGPPKPPKKAKLTPPPSAPTIPLTKWQQKALEYDDFNTFIRENRHELAAEGMLDFDKMTAMWTETRYINSEQGLHELDPEAAVQTIRDNIKVGTLDGWFRDADSDYKPILEDLIIKNPDVRNAGLNIAYQNYLEYTGKDITFEEFLNTPITVYRGGNNSVFTSADVFRSYTYDPEIAKSFGGDVVSIDIIPRFSLGSYQTTSEYEILVSPYTLEMGRKAIAIESNESKTFEIKDFRFFNPIDKNTDLDAIGNQTSKIAALWNDIKTVNNSYGAKAAQAKNELVTEIAKRLESDPEIVRILRDQNVTAYNKTNELIHNWAITSGDNSAEAIAIQMAVNEEFNLDATLSHFVGNGLQLATGIYTGDEKTLLKAFVRNQYEYTQEKLAENHITSIPLFRGAILKDQDFAVAQRQTYAARLIDVTLQPASSFSLDYEVAKEFADINSAGGYNVSEVMFVEVPAERILGTFRTGFGCMDESEFVVLGTKTPETVNSLTTTGRISLRLSIDLPLSEGRALQELAGVYDPPTKP